LNVTGLITGEQYIVDTKNYSQTFYITVYSQDDSYGYNGAIVSGYNAVSWFHFATNTGVIVTFYSLNGTGACLSPLAVNVSGAQVVATSNYAPDQDDNICGIPSQQNCRANFYNLTALIPSSLKFPVTGFFPSPVATVAIPACGLLGSEDEISPVPGSSVIYATSSQPGNSVSFVQYDLPLTGTGTYGYLGFGYAPYVIMFNPTPANIDSYFVLDWFVDNKCALDSFSATFQPQYEIILI